MLFSAYWSLLMSTEMKVTHSPARTFLVTIDGKIDISWSDWLGGLEIVLRKEADGRFVTTLSGVLADQAALRGLLNRLWDMNLVLRSFQQVDPTAKKFKK
jgi:hypothetical protein